MKVKPPRQRIPVLETGPVVFTVTVRVRPAKLSLFEKVALGLPKLPIPWRLS